MCSTKVKDQNRMMKLSAGRKHLLITVADSMFCWVLLFVFFFFPHTRINRNEDMKREVGEI